MVDRMARDKLRHALAILRTEQAYTSQSLAHIRPTTKDKSASRIYDELIEKINFSLPSQPNTDPAALTIQELSPTIEKAELFLESELEYMDPDEGWDWLNITMAIGLFTALLTVALLAFGGSLLTDQARFYLKIILAISAAVYLGPIVLIQAVALFLMGIHIFRVRILRQNLGRPVDTDDYWPFIAKEQYEQVLNRQRT